MHFRLSTARQALKLGVVFGAFSTLAAFGQLADANVSEAAALRARMAPLAAKIGGDFSDAALARALGVDPKTFRDPRAGEGADLAPNPLLADLGPAADLSGLSGVEARLVNASTPFADAAPAAARPFVLTGPAADQKRAMTCMTQAVYFEAGSESTDGGRAVAQVVLNRMRNAMFPHSVCGVVYQGSSLSTGCQFSFTCDGSLSKPVAGWAWDRSKEIARDALHGRVFAGVGLATHYHADYVAPYWMRSVSKVATIGAHIFYRWPGELGQPQAFTAAYASHERMGAPPAPAPLAAPQDGLTLASAARGADGRMHAEIRLAAAEPAPVAVKATPVPITDRPPPLTVPAVAAQAVPAA